MPFVKYPNYFLFLEQSFFILIKFDNLSTFCSLTNSTSNFTEKKVQRMIHLFCTNIWSNISSVPRFHVYMRIWLYRIRVISKLCTFCFNICIRHYSRFVVFFHMLCFLSFYLICFLLFCRSISLTFLSEELLVSLGQENKWQQTKIDCIYCRDKETIEEILTDKR